MIKINMKTKYKILSLAIMLLGVTGCKKSFLELAPQSNSNAQIFYKTKADMDLAVTAAYATLYTIYAPEGPMSYTGEMMGDNCTLYVIAGNQTDKFAFRDYNLQTTNTLVYSFWQQFYASLYNINIVLNKLDDSELSATDKTSVKAQMSFLRALYYFNMVRLWGDVPIVTGPLSVDDAYKLVRSPKADVYNFILNDAAFAAANLPASSIGKATKGAAQTLMGEIYLTLGDKTKATTALMDVYNSNLYQLMPTYAAAFGPNVKNTKESIFEIQYQGGSSSVSTNTASPYYRNFSPNVSVLGFSGIGMNQVTDDLYNEYETGDPRRDITITLGYQNGSAFTLQKYPIKWADPTAYKANNNVYANNNFMVYRFADVLLMLSEATDDPQYLNMVRTRATLPLYGTAGYPSTKYGTLATAVEHERRVELAIEFHRWFDLVRTNRAVTVLTAKGKPVTAPKLLLPIPETVRLQNSAITQNPGY